jgi:hypothetical protein
MMACPGVHQSLPSICILSIVFFLPRRLEVACAQAPVSYSPPSPSCIGVEFPFVDANVLIEQVGCHTVAGALQPVHTGVMPAHALASYGGGAWDQTPLKVSVGVGPQRGSSDRRTLEALG